jgi:Autotransporter beta-domain
MKTKFIIALLFICNLAFPQKDYNFLIEGGIGYRFSDDNSGIEKSNFIQKQEHLLQLNPVLGYFFSKNIVAGLGFEYLYDNIKYDNYSYYKAVENDFSIVPFLRFYTKFGLFLHTEFDYGISKLSFYGRTVPGPTGFIDPSEYYHFKIIGFSAGIGYSIKLNDYLGIEPSIRYIGGKYNENDVKNDFSRKGLLMNIGMVYFIK